MLNLSINPDADVPITTQLVNQISRLIATGKLAKGDQLPTIRLLADELGIHMHTVRAAYQRLEALQLVVIRRRLGTIVSGFDPAAWAAEHERVRSHTIGVLLPPDNALVGNSTWRAGDVIWRAGDVIWRAGGVIWRAGDVSPLMRCVIPRSNQGTHIPRSPCCCCWSTQASSPHGSPPGKR